MVAGADAISGALLNDFMGTDLAGLPVHLGMDYIHLPTNGDGACKTISPYRKRPNRSRRNRPIVQFLSVSDDDLQELYALAKHRRMAINEICVRLLANATLSVPR